MKQLFYLFPNQGVKMMDVPEPMVELPDEVKIKIEYAAICGSDAHNADGANDANYKAMGMPIDTMMPLGHESSGIITEIGKDVTTVKVGDRVTLNALLPCHKCHWCRTGHENLCEHVTMGKGSGMAEYIVLPESEVFKLPDDLSTRACSITEPLHIALESIEKSEVKAGESVAIIGGGPIGMLALQVAKLRGAYPVVLFDIFDEKIALAEKLGADAAFNSRLSDAAQQAIAITGGIGFNKVIECAGSPKVLDMAMQLASKAGMIVITAVYNHGTQYALDMGVLFNKELTIRGIYIASNTFMRSLNLLHRIDYDNIITAEFPLDAYEEAFAAHKNGKNIKVIFKLPQN